MHLVLTATYYLLVILQMLLLIRVIMSWLPINRSNILIEFVHTTTDPLLDPIKLLINKSIFGGKNTILDFSPLIAFLILQLLQSFVVSLL